MGNLIFGISHDVLGRLRTVQSLGTPFPSGIHSNHSSTDSVIRVFISRLSAMAPRARCSKQARSDPGITGRESLALHHRADNVIFKSGLKLTTKIHAFTEMRFGKWIKVSVTWRLRL